MINIVLCGGSGTRLWPVSREYYPKQFCNLLGSVSLFRETLNRNRSICEKTVVVTNSNQYFLAASQINDMDGEKYKFLLEPVGRNTAPAIMIACLTLNEDDVVLVTPSDHHIKDVLAYEKAVARAKQLAEDGFLVTFGIKPKYPETGFGYIEADGESVISFREKPDKDTAKRYIEEGRYFWNSGMFAFRVKTFLNEMRKYAGQILDACTEAFLNAKAVNNTIKIDLEYMEKIPKNSIDYAVMEKSDIVKMVESDIKWSDLGSFEAVAEISDRDVNGNVSGGAGFENSRDKHIFIGANDNFVMSNGKPVTIIDANGLIVVDTPDSILVSKKGSSHKIKDAILKLEEISPGVTKTHVTAYRPWGSYTVLDEGPRCKVKRIMVKQGHGISLQKHYHRSEHWTVVSGTAKITLGGEEVILCSNESIYIPMGQTHRLENPGKMDLVIVETQVGDYLGEDDIVRLEDLYGRV